MGQRERESKREREKGLAERERERERDGSEIKRVTEKKREIQTETGQTVAIAMRQPPC